MSNNLVSKDNLLNILSPIKTNIVNKINDKDINEEQKEKLNKTNIIDTTTASSGFLSDNGKYNNISMPNLNETIDKTNNVYDIFKIKENELQEWSVGNPIPTQRYGLVSEKYNGKIYCIGGYTRGSGPSNKVEIYDIKTDTWSNGSPMPNPREYIACCICSDKIYVMGGNIKNIDIYDITNDKWSETINMPIYAPRLISQIINNKIYCIGGVYSIFFKKYLYIRHIK